MTAIPGSPQDETISYFRDGFAFGAPHAKPLWKLPDPDLDNADRDVEGATAAKDCGSSLHAAALAQLAREQDLQITASVKRHHDELSRCRALLAEAVSARDAARNAHQIAQAAAMELTAKLATAQARITTLEGQQIEAALERLPITVTWSSLAEVTAELNDQIWSSQVTESRGFDLSDDEPTEVEIDRITLGHTAGGGW